MAEMVKFSTHDDSCPSDFFKKGIDLARSTISPSNESGVRAIINIFILEALAILKEKDNVEFFMHYYE